MGLVIEYRRKMVSSLHRHAAFEVLHAVSFKMKHLAATGKHRQRARELAPVYVGLHPAIQTPKSLRREAC